MRIFLCTVLLLSLAVGLSAQEIDFQNFTGKLDKRGNPQNNEGWAIFSIGGKNEALQEAVWELVSDVSSAEVGLISAEVWASSSSATDASGGNGAQSLEVSYYDTSNALLSKTIALNGQSTVSVGIVNYVLGARVKYEGSSGQVGDIYISNSTVASGVPAEVGKIHAKIPADQGATQNGLFVVPAGAKAMIKKIIICGNGAALVGRLMSKKPGLAERAILPNIYSTLGTVVECNVAIPLESEELVWMEAIGTAASDCSMALFIYYKE